MKWLLLLALPLAAVVSKLTPEPAPAPDVDLFKKDAQVFSGHAELLVWATSVGGLNYAITTTPTTQAGLIYPTGHFNAGTYNVEPGFRVALSYFRAPHYWETKWQYTRMTSRGTDITDAPTTGALEATFPYNSGATFGTLSSAQSYVHLNYNVFDWFVDRVFIPNPHLRLRTIGGMFAAWMDQFWKISYSGSLGTLNTTNRWSYAGAGLKLGTMVDWYWTGDLYMTAATYFGAMIGSYSNLAQQDTTLNLKLNDTRGAYTIQMLFGPSWQKNYKKNRIEIFTGFESNLWFNLQEIYRAGGATTATASELITMTSGLLSMYGATVRLTVDF